MNANTCGGMTPEQLYSDCMTLAIRMLSVDTMAPETMAVMDRWRDAAEAAVDRAYDAPQVSRQACVSRPSFPVRPSIDELVCDWLATPVSEQKPPWTSFLREQDMPLILEILDENHESLMKNRDYRLLRTLAAETYRALLLEGRDRDACQSLDDEMAQQNRPRIEM